MAMFACYLDDSGTHDPESGHLTVVTIGGFVAREDHWDEFAERWVTAVHSMGLSKWHSTDAWALRREYSGWDKSRRDAALLVLQDILEQVSGIISAAIVVPVDRYEMLSTEARTRFGSAYGLAAHMLFANLGYSLVSQGYDSDAMVSYVMDHPGAGNGYGATSDLYNEMRALPDVRDSARLAALRSSDTISHPQLQAADIVAYEVGKEWARWGAQRAQWRFSLMQLSKMKRIWMASDPAFIRRVDEGHERALYFPEEGSR